MTATDQHEIDRRYDELYARYAKPLEEQHRGRYAAVSEKGDLVLGTTLLDVAQKAKEQFGPGAFVFKIGEPTVGRWVQ